MTTIRNSPSRAERLTVLAYGTLVYLFFFVTFLYAIGFVTGVGVPKGIDDGAPAPLAEALLVNGGLLALFAIQHMIMARQGFKRVWTRVIPAAAERSTFVLAASAILAVTFLAWRPMTGVIWEATNPVAATILQGVAFLGFGLVLVATFLIDHFDLFGLRQVIRHFRGVPYREPEFRVRSLYRRVRHPLYLGFLMAFWSTPVMTVGHLLFATLCTGFILVAVRLEERDLIRAHGAAYEDYRRRVPMLIPRPGRRIEPIAAEPA